MTSQSWKAVSKSCFIGALDFQGSDVVGVVAGLGEGVAPIA